MSGYSSEATISSTVAFIFLFFFLIVFFVFFIQDLVAIGANEQQNNTDNEQQNTSVNPSAPLEQPENLADAKERRMERIQSQLVYQQVLSLASKTGRMKLKKEKKPKKKKKKKTVKKRQERRNEAYDVGVEVDSSDEINDKNSSPLSDRNQIERKSRKKSKKRRKKSTTRNVNGKNHDIEMGTSSSDCDVERHDEEDARIHRGTSDTIGSTLRSIVSSIQLLVFTHHSRSESGIDENGILESKKAMKEQLSCSICLDEYVVGDIVVRHSSDACNHCFHETCILEWLESHDECPLCRFKMVPDTV